MGFFKQKIKNTHIIFEAPKTGGTTLRTWIYYYLTGKLIKNIDYSRDNNYYTLNGEATKFLLKNGYSNTGYLKEILDFNFSAICIIRDPVQRFLSCFYDKIIGEHRYKMVGLNNPPNLKEFVNNFSDLINISEYPSVDDHSKNTLKYHFAPLTYHYGSNPSIFNKIFWTRQINTDIKNYLEDLWGLKLPPIHARNSNRAKEYENIDNKLRNKIQSLYAIDYDSGFFI